MRDTSVPVVNAPIDSTDAPSADARLQTPACQWIVVPLVSRSIDPKPVAAVMGARGIGTLKPNGWVQNCPLPKVRMVAGAPDQFPATNPDQAGEARHAC